MRLSLIGLRPHGRRSGKRRVAGFPAARAGSAAKAAPDVSGRQPALDGLRVIAAFAVLVIHVGGETGIAFTGSPLSWIVSRGDVGVPIFFTLSGLLLYRPWAAAALDVGASPATLSYLWRRALRILPAYWAVVVVAFATLNHASVGSFLRWTQYLALVQVYVQRPWWDGTGAPGLAQMWSLAVEVSFYALLPVLAGLMTWYARRAGADVGRRARRLLTVIAVLTVVPFGLAVPEYYPTFQPWLGETLPRLLTWFTPGMAIAVLATWAQAEAGADGPVRRFARTVADSGGACWLIAAMIFIIACTPVTGPEFLTINTLWQTEIKLALYTVIAAAVVAPVAFQAPGPTRLSTILGNPVMRFLGKISYGIFLWQYVVIYGVFLAWHRRDAFAGGSFTTVSAAVALIAVILVTVAAATMSYYLIEKPALKFSRLIRPRPRSKHRRVPSGTKATGQWPAAANTPKLPLC